MGASAAICTSASRWSWSSSRRCARAARTCRSSPSAWAAPRPNACAFLHDRSPTPRSSASRGTAGRATCASSRTRSSALVLGAQRSGPIEAAEFDFLDEARADALGPIARALLASGAGLPAFERALLAEALAENRGNVSAAARALRLSRKAFEHRETRARSEEDA
ncbi:MAG: hypothetical protein IPJ19_20625 [Planctomycetes bacterium]|nr:hypothetical protein [Planctomycetota bacterium]